MKRQKRNRALSLAVLALGFCGVSPGWAAVTPGGDTTIAATASKDTTVGKTGVGTLSIDGGSTLTGAKGYLGNSAGSSGTATVSGTGSMWANIASLHVGYSGNGALTIESGGQVTSTQGSLGNNSGSTGTVTVSGAGSTWSTTFAQLDVGLSGRGVLTIEAGGWVNSNTGFVGNAAGSTGTVTVKGEGSTWSNSTNLDVGYYGTGALTIEAGGQVISNSASISNRGSGGTASVSGAGSRWTNNGIFTVGGSGTVTVSDGGIVSTQVLYASLSDLHGNGTITATTGAVLDADLVFDTTSGNTQTLAFGSGGAVHLTVDNGHLGVGYKGNGSLRINDGIVLTSSAGHLGLNAGSSGTATVSGTGSMWISSSLFVGSSGSGSLTVADGGQVNTGVLYASLSHLHGNGTITASDGAVLDADLVFDGTHGTTKTLPFGSGGTLNVSFGSTGALGVGYKDIGTLRIGDGVEMASASGRLGYNAGSRGTATVTGEGSKWTNSGDLYVGSSGDGVLTIEAGAHASGRICYVGWRNGSTGSVMVNGAGSKLAISTPLFVGFNGTGTLCIEGGGQVSNVEGHIGNTSSANGVATVAGTGSLWNSSGTLYVGNAGKGRLTVADGSKVTAKAVRINSQSDLRLHVSGDDMLVLGDTTTAGSLANNGTVNLFADALLPAGVYRPISEYAGRTMTLSGTYKAFGGTWSTSAKAFTVLAPTPLSAGDTDTLTTGERLLFTDELTGHHVGASFGSVVGSVSFSAAPMGAADLAGLAGVLEEGRGVLSAWDFVTNFSGGEAMLSFDIGMGAEELAVWHYSGGVWSEFVPSLFTYDANGIASFTVSSFSGYAVTAAVPEPGMMGLLALAGSVLLIRRRVRG